MSKRLFRFGRHYGPLQPKTYWTQTGWVVIDEIAWWQLVHPRKRAEISTSVLAQVPNSPKSAWTRGNIENSQIPLVADNTNNRNGAPN